MKTSDKYVFTIFLVLAVGLFLIVYYVPLKNTKDEISSINSSNGRLRKEITELQVYHDNKAQYESDTETLKNEVVNIISAYPSGYREEDFILEGIAMENSAEYLQYSSINANEAESLAIIDSETMKNAEIEGYENKVEFFKRRVDYNNELTYDSLKDALTEAFNSGYKANIESVTYVKDEVGVVLKGTITLSYYYVSGNGRAYEPPHIKSYEPGTNNIFLGGNSVDLTDFYPSEAENDETATE